MIIGIDVSMLVYAGSGVATYTDNLVKALLKYHPEHEYRLFYSSFRRSKSFQYLKNYKKMGAKVYSYRFPPRVLKWLWNKHHFLPVEWLIGKVDVFHSSDFLRPPLLAGTKGVTTIHDLTWKIFPEYHTPDIIEGHARKLEKTIKYKDIIITDSKNTKNDLLKYYPQAKDNKVEVIYLGIDERFRPIKDQNKIKQVLAKYNVKFPHRYLLYVGAIEPRKNVDLCIKVFNQLIKDNKYADFEFLLVGRAGWKNEHIFRLIKDLKLESKVRFVGYVEDDDMPYFYNSAKLTLYLSEYEGFGLPPLESLACTTPVLARDNSSLSETLNESLRTKNDDARVLVSLVKKLVEEGVLYLMSKHYYSWENYSRKILQLLG